MTDAGSVDYKVLIVGAAVKGATNATVKSFIDNAVTPFLRGQFKTKVEQKIKSSITRYVKNVESRTRNIPCIAMPAGSFFLDSIYEPLSVVPTQGDQSVLVDGYPAELFAINRCIAITDDAGMGKSTLAKYILRRAIETSKNIPLFVELRRLRKGRSILNSISEEMAAGDEEVSSALVDLMRSGNFVFIFDGYDEVDDEIRSEIAYEINKISSDFQFCYFIVTSRKGYGLSVFNGYSEFYIKKLNEQQAKSLISRYDQGRGLSKILIDKIKKAEIADFLGNPLLVTLLYKAFDYRQSIPLKKSIFFRQVYEALFQDHDLSKGDAYERKKVSGLDLDEFHRFLRALGFVTLKAGRVSYSAEEFSMHIDASIRRAQINVDGAKIKLDLVRAVPIFAKEGLEYRWVHKSFQEYFAANYSVFDLREKSLDFVGRVFNSNPIKYSELIKFIAEADITLFRNACVSPFYSAYFSAGSSDEECLRIFLINNVRAFYVKPGRNSIEYRDIMSKEIPDGFHMRHLFLSSKFSFFCYSSLKAAALRAIAASDGAFIEQESHAVFDLDLKIKFIGDSIIQEIDLNDKRISFSKLKEIASCSSIPFISFDSYKRLKEYENERARMVGESDFGEF